MDIVTREGVLLPVGQGDGEVQHRLRVGSRIPFPGVLKDVDMESGDPVPALEELVHLDLAIERDVVVESRIQGWVCGELFAGERGVVAAEDPPEVANVLQQVVERPRVQVQPILEALNVPVGGEGRLR